MSRKRNVITLANIALLGVLMTFNNCGDYRTPRTQKTSTMGNPNRQEKTDFAVSKYQGISGLTICLKEMVLTKVGGGTITVPYSPSNELQISMSGIELGALDVPAGQYTKIALSVDDVCETGKSVAVTNGNGTFRTTSPFEIQFQGNEFIGNVQHRIVLDVKSLTEKLSRIDTNADIYPEASASRGLYHSTNCGLQTSAGPAAFCDSFDAPAVAKGRSGQLENAVWSVGRLGPSNQGQGQFNLWSDSSMDVCGTLQNAVPGTSDLRVCNGQLRQSTRDRGNVTAFAMSPNQPFDFTGRTGTVAFDITNDTSGTMGVYPKVFLTDKSVPAPQVFGVHKSFSKNGIEIRFAGNFGAQEGAFAPGCPNDEHERWIVDGVSIISNYTARSIAWHANDPQFVTYGCVIASRGPNGGMNHIELRVSQDEVEVWATDAGDAGLKKIAAIRNIRLPFGRGYLSFGDYHNNAGTGSRPDHANHTFAWDNIAFDGPALARDIAAEVPDAMASMGNGLYSLGYFAQPSSPANLNTLPISQADVTRAQVNGKPAAVTLNFTAPFASATNFEYTVNGRSFNMVVPYVALTYESHAIDLPFPASALVAGPQVISIKGSESYIIYNVSARVTMN